MSVHCSTDTDLNFLMIKIGRVKYVKRKQHDELLSELRGAGDLKGMTPVKLRSLLRRCGVVLQGGKQEMIEQLREVQ